MRLVYQTKKPPKGFISFAADATHMFGLGERSTDPAQERAAFHLVNEALTPLLNQLHEMGYDYTSARFSIQKKDIY